MLKKIFNLIRFRMLQILRMLKTVGWSLGLVSLLATAGIIMSFINSILGFSAIYSLVFTVIYLGLIEYTRKDKFFLISIFPSKFTVSIWVATEYILMLLPILVYQLFSCNVIITSFNLLAILLISAASPYYHVGESTAKKVILSYLSLNHFEIKFSAERYAIFWVVFWFLGFLGMVHIAFYISWLFILMLSFGEAFRHFENREMIHWKNRFVLNKISQNTALMIKIIFLQTLATMFFQIEYYQYIIYVDLCLFVVLWLNIAQKYSLYNPLHFFHSGQNSLAIFTLFALIPGGVLVTFVYTVIKYLRSEKNMNFYYA